ncbi:MAG TPA: hypothetical protein QGH36_05450, partial [Candidatus Marinimicrobia bacterium]|nr:hypothetical protein [Candidatus Neomarinimicrobiota bacterium]
MNNKKVGGINEWIIAGIVLSIFLIVIPLLNKLPGEDSWLRISEFRINLLGKFLAFAILAMGLNLAWGYTGILSLGQG